MNIKKIILIALIGISAQTFGMPQLKKSLKEIIYAITPASGNPLTWFGNNFHTVQANQAYRSKTMSSSDLEYYIKNKPNIKTIINLREANGTWFEKEQEVASRNNVQLYTITLDSKALPTQQQLKNILQIFQDFKNYPILFHCQAGVDRTSLVAAFWKLMMQNATLEEALEQMTPSYGHFEWSRPLMRKCIELLDATRDENGKINLEKYNPENAMKNIFLKPLPMRATKSLVSIVKNSPERTAGIFTLAVAITGLSFYLFRK